MSKTFDILSVGELLIDFLSETYADSISAASSFRQFQGGSAANFCLNSALLGNQTKFVASLGDDAMGDFLLNAMQQYTIDCSDIAIIKNQPTTLILVTRSQASPDFQAYREADCQINEEQLSDTILQNCKIFHTTCFALSKNPAQTTIINAAAKAANYGAQLSIDLNYAQKIWNDRAEAQAIVQKYCSYGALIKVSEDDWERLYETKAPEPNEIADFFKQLGAKEVCVTLGSKGCFISNDEENHFIKAQTVNVVDTTGAGDAFWSGYMTAKLDGYDAKTCAMAGSRMAAIKLGYLGQMTESIDKQRLYL